MECPRCLAEGVGQERRGDSVAVSTVAELADKLITKGFADIRLPHHRLDRHAANSGQVCNALSRILVPDARKDEFVDALAAGMRSITATAARTVPKASTTFSGRSAIRNAAANVMAGTPH